MKSFARKTRSRHGSTRGIWLVAALLLCLVCLFAAACEDVPEGTPSGESTRFASVTEEFRTEYYVGDQFDPSGELKTFFDIDYYSLVPITADMVSGFDTSSAGDVILTIRYQDFVATVPIRVLPLTATSITLDNAPTVIYKGDAFPEGVTLTAQMSNGETRTVSVTQSMLGGFNSSRVGEQNVTVSYMGAPASFRLNVKEDVRLGISLVGAKAEYAVNELLSTEGASVVTTYESGKTESKQLEASFVSEAFSTALGGSYTVKVTYRELSCDYTYFVRKAPASFLLTPGSLPATFEKRDPLPSGGAGVLVYDDRTEEQISSLAAENIPDFDTSVAGEHTVDVLVSGIKTSYTYTVLPDIVGVEVFGYTQNVQQGKAFDGVGELIVLYESGSETIKLSSSRLEIVKYDTETTGLVTQQIAFRRRVIPFDVRVYAENERYDLDGIILSGGFAPVKAGTTVLDPSGVRVTICYKYFAWATESCLPEWITVAIPQEIEGDSVRVPVTVTYQTPTQQVATKETDVLVLSEAYTARITELRPERTWKSVYVVGEELFIEDSYLTAIFGGGYRIEQSVPMSADYVEDFDTTTAGEKNMTINYRYRGATEDAVFTIRVPYRVIDVADAEKVTDFTVSSFSPRLFVGDTVDAIDCTGGRLNVTYGYGYSSGTVELVGTMLSGDIDGNPARLTITYGGVSKEIEVAVHPAAEKTLLTSIRVPQMIESYIGIAPDLDRYPLELVYGYGYATERIPLSSEGVRMGSFSVLEAGITYVEVAFTRADGVTLTCTAQVSFTAASGANVLKSIEIQSGSVTQFEKGGALTGVRILVTYMNDEKETVDVTLEMAPDFSTETVGRRTVEVAYGGYMTLYTYEVTEG